MANSETFKELEQQIEAVLDSESTDFFELAAMLDLDPKQDFAGAELAGVNLSGKDLTYANFTGTNLRGADLSYANLEGADFTNANLSSPLLLIFIKISEDKDSANLFGKSSLNYYINLAFNITLNLARDPARTLDFVDSLYSELERELDRDLESEIDRHNYWNRVLDRHEPELDIKLANDLHHSVKTALDIYGKLAQDLENISYFNLNQIQNRYLGTIFSYANLASTCWEGASAVGALMIQCQSLTAENVTELKTKGVIFDDAPGDSQRTDSPFSPRSPVPN